jgi:hypothetical protein
MRETSAKFSETLDESIERIRAQPARVALIEALGLGICVSLLGVKLLEVQSWLRKGHEVRDIDLFGFRTTAADIRRIADALELAADRAEKDLVK